MTQNSPSYLGGGAYSIQDAASKYPNPFCDIASMYIPQNLNDAFEWTEFLMLTMAPFMAVTKRVVSYFLTEIDLDCEAGDDVIDKYEDLLMNKIHIMEKLQAIGIDYFTYGNSFSSLYFPFNRFLVCPKCGMWYHCKTMQYEFDPVGTKFKCKCKKCGYEGDFEPHDLPDRGNTGDVRVIRWNPKRMHIKVNPISGKCQYEYDLEPEFVERVRQGRRLFVDSTPIDILEACAQSEQQKDTNMHRFVFNEDAVHHMKEPGLAGLRNMHAWGMPPMLPYFKLAYYIQLLRRYDEAIALDFIIPFRILFPQFNGPQGQDALTTVSMQTFISAMQSMIAKKRMNIATYEVAPFPVGYQMVGGEAKQLAPKDNIQEALNELLSAMGFPQELFTGNLTLQAAPVALRLFERQFNVLVDNFNVIIQWMLDRVSAHFRWEPAQGRLSSITLADDIERKGMQLQAAAGMDVSKSTAYKALGLDYIDEQEKLINEQKEIQDLQTKAMLDQQAETENGEGNAPGAGANPATTPGDMYSAAQDMTQQLLGMTHTQRRQYLAKVKQTNPTMHALLLQMLEEARRGMASQGQQMIMQQNGMPQ